MIYNTLLVEISGPVGVIQLNRPSALNALNDELVTELTAALDRMEADSEVGCIVLTGSQKAFAAGADIKEMRSLTRLVGKSKAMEMCLTGRMMDASEAERAGLVSRVVPLDNLLEEARSAALKIATMSRPIAMMTKESVNASYETMLRQGIMFERRLFHSMFSTDDQKEGMAAFVEKRSPQFSGR